MLTSILDNRVGSEDSAKAMLRQGGVIYHVPEHAWTGKPHGNGQYVLHYGETTYWLPLAFFLRLLSGDRLRDEAVPADLAEFVDERFTLKDPMDIRVLRRRADRGIIAPRGMVDPNEIRRDV